MARKRRKPMAEINVVPYIDVMLVLLVIFMISAPLLTQGVKIELPQAKTEMLNVKPTETVVVKVDVQGAATIKEIMPQAVFVFLMPPSLEELEKRLRRRHSESTTGLALRLEKAKGEVKNLQLFDYVITSRQDKVDEVVFQIDAIVTAEKRRVNPRIVQV